ncbi:YtpR family tRNA-binding protein [Halobacillus sp. B23F22_1]|uniref:YtpR family tRNA-binding protein n=1 Tax=Halobacillus sp. B23F22_1 TaxID=3459514 RepID=UPI00373E9AA6
MNVFYNPNGIGDVLIIPVKQGERLAVTYDKFGDIVKITDQNDGSLLGYNIFQASNYFNFAEHGKLQMTEEILDQLKNLFKRNNIEDSLEFDLSPKFVVGHVITKDSHENADKLSVCQVDVGKETLQIVCGAPNVKEGQNVVVAKVGAVMPSGMAIKSTELRGVPSAGMICSAKELGLKNAPQEKGILVLTGEEKPGQPFEF